MHICSSLYMYEFIPYHVFLCQGTSSSDSICLLTSNVHFYSFPSGFSHGLYFCTRFICVMLLYLARTSVLCYYACVPVIMRLFMFVP